MLDLVLPEARKFEKCPFTKTTAEGLQVLSHVDVSNMIVEPGLGPVHFPTCRAVEGSWERVTELDVSVKVGLGLETTFTSWALDSGPSLSAQTPVAVRMLP
jgi:hypothetical protein